MNSKAEKNLETKVEFGTFKGNKKKVYNFFPP